PWEMNYAAPLEALKAQAICARSETLSKIAGGRHRADGYDICDYDHCQGYKGTENEKASASRAVEETSGLAIFYRGRIADAVYGTNSGGLTASAEDVWRGPPEPYLRGTPDYSPAKHRLTAGVVKPTMNEADWVVYCSQNLPSYAQPSSAQTRALAARRLSSSRTATLFQPNDLPEFYRWTRVVTAKTLAQSMSRWIKMNNVTEVRVLERAASGHIKRLLVRGPAPAGSTPPGEATWTFAGDSQIRAMMSGRLGSTTALPSSTFVVLPQRDAKGVVTAFIFKGAGWGHGVGMCQRGAQNHAREGWNARRIIQFYFRDVELRKVG
ncbi:MAG: SpoIID/LytB domain-containing protein, partial [Armatimonadota bacterium]|nr:SpoIID/LytB domain-containing protein [Armatimonadota bacterium]